MCGIAGAFGPDRPDDGRVERTLALMRNRGPDAHGVFRGTLGENNVTLLATRLAIIDLDPRSNQPFEHDDCVIAYNGETYNYLEIRAELETAGHRFRTDSDTEVIVQAYRRHGDDFVDRLEGMWAFALFDRRDGKLVLSRDRFGEKPLYYMRVNGTLYFASEVKFLMALSGHRPAVNADQLRRYLVNGYKSLYKGGDSFFEGVRELPPAHRMTLRDGPDAEPLPYWRLEYRPRAMTAEDAREGARERLFEAVRLRLRADVPLAFCLSGGIDSGTLVSIAGRALGHDVHAFSIIDGDPRYNERDNIMAVVDDLGCAHHLVHTSPDGFFDRMKMLVGYHDMPVATINYYMHAFLSEAIAEQGFKVVLSGTAADELFTGYYDHYGFWLAEMQHRPDFPRLVEDWKESYGRFVRNPLLQSPTAFVNNPEQREHIYLNQELFEGYLTQPFHEDFGEEAYSDNLLLHSVGGMEWQQVLTTGEAPILVLETGPQGSLAFALAADFTEEDISSSTTVFSSADALDWQPTSEPAFDDASVSVATIAPDGRVLEVGQQFSEGNPPVSWIGRPGSEDGSSQ